MSRTRSRPATGLQSRHARRPLQRPHRPRQAEPRVGISYNVKPTNTVLRRLLRAHARNSLQRKPRPLQRGLSAPYSRRCSLCTTGVAGTLQPGFRNEFHAGFQQAFGKNFVVSGEYIWKYTHNAFDFSILGNTPIFFPIDWHNSKIPGYALHADVPNFHNLSAYVVMSSVAARFFPPQVAGAGATVGQSGYPFRIDHDERFNETTHVQYQLPGHPSALGRFQLAVRQRLRRRHRRPATTPRIPNSPMRHNFTTLNGQPGVDLSGLTPMRSSRPVSPATA